MKADGRWMLWAGMPAHYATEARTITPESGKLVVDNPTQPIWHRGVTLQGLLLPVTLNSPLADVIWVRIEHHIGGNARGPEIPLVPTDGRRGGGDRERGRVGDVADRSPMKS